tara:strand:+ start:3677 stop:3871 length:195 start_codon:yes stop_codon:yes gene_type:complete
MFEADDGLIADTTWTHAVELQKEIIYLKAKLFVAEQVVATLSAQIEELSNPPADEEETTPTKKK